MSEVPSHMQWWAMSINSETHSDFIQTIRTSGPSFILKGVFHSVAVTFLQSSSLWRSATCTGIFSGFLLNEKYMTAFLDNMGSQERMLALHFLQRQLKIACINMSANSCRYYAIDGSMTIDIHESLEEEHFPSHGFAFFFPCC